MVSDRSGPTEINFIGTLTNSSINETYSRSSIGSSSSLVTLDISSDQPLKVLKIGSIFSELRSKGNV